MGRPPACSQAASRAAGAVPRGATCRAARPAIAARPQACVVRVATGRQSKRCLRCVVAEPARHCRSRGHQVVAQVAQVGCRRWRASTRVLLQSLHRQGSAGGRMRCTAWMRSIVPWRSVRGLPLSRPRVRFHILHYLCPARRRRASRAHESLQHAAPAAPGAVHAIPASSVRPFLRRPGQPRAACRIRLQARDPGHVGRPRRHTTRSARHRGHRRQPRSGQSRAGSPRGDGQVRRRGQLPRGDDTRPGPRERFATRWISSRPTASAWSRRWARRSSSATPCT